MCMSNNVMITICVLGSIFLVGLFTVITTIIINCFLVKKNKQSECNKRADDCIVDLVDKIQKNCPFKKQ